MAKVTVKGLEELNLEMGRLAEAGVPIAKMAIYEGAGMMTDAIRAQIMTLPIDTPRWLKDGDEYSVLVQQDRDDLANSLGIAEIRDDEKGVRTVIGFAGYGRHKTKKYRKGLPMAMIARSIESGSSVRRKHPFMRPTVSKNRKAVTAKIIVVAENAIENTIKGKG